MIDHSYGVIPVIWNDKEPQFFLIQHKDGLHWGFPKGHAEKNETPKEAAFRELKEETSLEPIKDLTISPFEEKYTFEKNGKTVYKTVLYFLVQVTKEYILDSKEVKDGGFYSYLEALEKITFQESKNLLEKIKDTLQKKQSL